MKYLVCFYFGAMFMSMLSQTVIGVLTWRSFLLIFIWPVSSGMAYYYMRANRLTVGLIPDDKEPPQ